MSVIVKAANLSQVERRLGYMKEKASKVLKMAVNDTAKKARSRLAKEAKKKYVVKVSGFKSVMGIKLATNNNPEAVIHASGKKIPLAKFSYKEGQLGTGKILKGTRFKASSSAKLKWFVAKMGSGHIGIFSRNGGMKRGQKGEISEKMGASIPEMIGNEKQVYGVVEPHIQDDLKEAVNRHVMRALRGEI